MKRPMKVRKFLSVFTAFSISISVSVSNAEQPVNINYSRAELEAMWRIRIQSFLDVGVIPLIDLQSSLKRRDGEAYFEDAIRVMDEVGVALIAFDGYQARRNTKKQKGYRWGYYIHKVVNLYPGLFILAGNGGTNNNWVRGKKSFISQTEKQIRSGDYPIMGEFEFRHYMSRRQCRAGLTYRDVHVSVEGPNAHRLFQLSAESGIPFVIHNEPENDALRGLERMLKAYPEARVIHAHFGQIRQPSKQNEFTVDRVRYLLRNYPNLYFDLATGRPGRIYKCSGEKTLDTIIWRRIGDRQFPDLADEWKAIIVDFSDRFVVGLDYGGGRGPLGAFIRNRVENIRLIMRDLPRVVTHAIGYRNAWRLLTGRPWHW